MNVTEFEKLINTPSDINEHMPFLRDLAKECDHITEFGVRTGNSTISFLAGLKPEGKLVSYDINDCSNAVEDPRWTFIQADTSKLKQIEETDLLFIDTLHDYAQVVEELKHYPNVTGWIVLHDTVLFGSRDESTGKEPGIMQAVLEMLRKEIYWHVAECFPNNNGLLVLENIW